MGSSMSNLIWWSRRSGGCSVRAEGQYERDIVLESVQCWTTPVPLHLFHASTGLDAYPEALQPSVREACCSTPATAR